MSQVTAFSLTCPSCGKQEFIARPVLFDAALHPAEVQQIKDGTYFTARCPSCDASQDFLMNMLYIDRAHHFMAALQPNPAMPAPAPDAETIRTMQALRLVRDAEDLSDKVRQLESAIDDRIIEIAKYLLYVKIRPALPAGSVMGMPVFHDGTVPLISLPMEIKGKGYAMGTDKLTEDRVSELTRLYGKAIASDHTPGFRLIDRDYARRIVEMTRA